MLFIAFVGTDRRRFPVLRHAKLVFLFGRGREAAGCGIFTRALGRTRKEREREREREKNRPTTMFQSRRGLPTALLCGFVLTTAACHVVCFGSRQPQIVLGWAAVNCSKISSVYRHHLADVFGHGSDGFWRAQGDRDPPWASSSTAPFAYGQRHPVRPRSAISDCARRS